MDPRLSYQTLRVLRLLMDVGQLCGADISKQTEMLSGTVYPILMRLEKAGWLTSKWERIEPSKEGRPRKRLYRLTRKGHEKAMLALTALS